MAEIIAGLEAPVYVERTTCTDQKNIMRTRKAIRKALRLQKEKKGYSFIEILSACPTNWKKSPKESIEWIQSDLEPYFKPGVYKDISEEVEPFTQAEECKDVDTILESLELTKGASQSTVPQGFGEKRIKFAGFGGQGVLTGGLLLAKTGMEIGLNVSWIPSYGPEMRGGTANCSVIISDKRIASPLVNTPDILVAMNGPSLDAFEKDVKAGGIILVNTSLVDRKVEREDVEVVYAPLTDIALDLGFKGAANSVAIGALLNKTEIFPIEKVVEVLPGFFNKPKAVDLNINALKAGSECI